MTAAIIARIRSIAVFQAAEVLGARLRTCDFTGNIIRFKELLNERRVEDQARRECLVVQPRYSLRC